MRLFQQPHVTNSAVPCDGLSMHHQHDHLSSPLSLSQQFHAAFNLADLLACSHLDMSQALQGCNEVVNLFFCVVVVHRSSQCFVQASLGIVKQS